MTVLSEKLRDCESVLNSWLSANLSRSQSGPYVSNNVPLDVALFAGALYKRGLKCVKNSDGIEHTVPQLGNREGLIPPLSLMKRVKFLNDFPLAENDKSIFILLDSSLCRHWPEWETLKETHLNILVLEATEQNKNLATVAGILEKMLPQTASVMAIGGGITLDMGGFVAGLCNIPVDYVSTTLLASVDAAVGGKTGVNHFPFGKNQIGLFSGARSLTVVPEYFQSLSELDISCGLSEAVKHSWLEGSFAENEALYRRILEAGSQALVADLSTLVLKNYETKVGVVLKDPFEKHLRKTLNFGHTLAHVLEGLAEAGHLAPIPHGMAVAVGIQALIDSELIEAGPDGLSRFLEEILESGGVTKPLKILSENSVFLDAARMLFSSDKKNSSKADGADFVLPSYGLLKTCSAEDEFSNSWAKTAHIPFAEIHERLLKRVTL